MQIIIIAPQGAGKTAASEKIRAALGDEYTIVEETPRMVAPSGLKEIFTTHESWVPLSALPAQAEMPAFAIPFLGHVPDTHIARHIGWTNGAVRTRRERLGMAPCDVGRVAKHNIEVRAQAKKAFLAAKKAAGFITPTDEE